jgi:hypothetical protein
MEAKPKNPKTKAKQLARKMFSYQWRQGAEHASDKEYRNAVNCAIVVVDEILKQDKEIIAGIDYWKTVKLCLIALKEGR